MNIEYYCGDCLSFSQGNCKKHNIIVDIEGFLCDEFELHLNLKSKFRNKIEYVCIPTVYWHNMKHENQQLKEALRKCIPVRIDAYLEFEGVCPFCGVNQDFDLCEETLHTNDCEYIKLTKTPE